MKRNFDSSSFLKLLEIALVFYLIIFGTFLAWVYGRANIAEKRWRESGRIESFDKLGR